MLWQPVSEHPTGECSRQDYCEDDKTNDQWIEHDRVPRLERLKKLEEATLLAKSAREATWFVVRPMAAAVNSTNEQSWHYGPPAIPLQQTWGFRLS